MVTESDARSWWDAEVAELRSELAALGSIHLDTLVLPSENDAFGCVDIWLHGGATFIDLVGNCVAGRPVPGIAAGFAFIQFRTWKNGPNGMDEVYSAAERTPAPKAHGLNAAFTQRVLVPLLQRIFRREWHSFPLHSAGELPQALNQHLELVKRTPGAVVYPDEPALECRFKWQNEE